MLGESLHIASEYLTQEAKVASLAFRMEVLEAKNSTLKKKLIESMHEVNTLKESSKTLTDDLRAERQLTLKKDEQLLVAKDKLKTIAAKSIEGFQQTNEYSTVLFSWYFKGFELLRRYLVKHPSSVDLQSLDLEVVDQEMAADEATQSSVPEEPAADQQMPKTLLLPLLVMTLLLTLKPNTCEEICLFPFFFFLDVILEQFNLF